MSEILSINGELRKTLGKGATRALRNEGKVPVSLYGKNFKNLSIAISAKAAFEMCHRFNAKTSLVELKIGSDKHTILPKQITLHPVTDEIQHLDLLSVKDSKQLKVDVPIKVIGRDSSPGIKRGGVVNMTTRFLTSKVNKDEIPSFIEVDISQMTIGDTVRLEDMQIPKNMHPIEKDIKTTILKLVGKKVKVEEEVTTEEAAEGEEKAEKAEKAEETNGEEKKEENNKKKEENNK